MLDFPSWKKWLTWATVIVGVLLAVPTLLSGTLIGPKLPAWMNKTKVNLGLDLAGGSYILLEAQTSDVRNQRLETMRDTILGEMRRAPRIAIGDISTRGGQISFMVRDTGQVDAVRERLLPLTAGAGLTGQRDWDIAVRDTNTVTMTPTDAGIAQATEQAMVDATEVVRRRVDELGTREPTIIRQGSNRIVVQVPGLQDPQALKELLGKTARLEFKLVDTAADPAALARGQALFARHWQAARGCVE